MAVKKRKKLNRNNLLKKGVPYILIPGLILASVLGWKTGAFEKVSDYYKMKQLFPKAGVVEQIEDGDTFAINDGLRVRLIGIDAPNRGEDNYEEAKEKLTEEILKKKIYLEYDRYQDDKYGRVLAWIWVDCEGTPRFLPADYMHKSGDESNPGLTENPKGCKKGKLVNEELVKAGFAKIVSYEGRGELKYEKRLLSF